MPWAKLDDQYPDHPKIVEVGPLGMALHTAATCYCARYLTDGFIPKAMIHRLISIEGISIERNGVSNAVTYKQITDDLVRVGLFEVASGGFKVHDYDKYNPPAEHVKAEREANAARQNKWRSENRDKDGKFVSNAVSNGDNNALVTPAPSPSPSPSPSPYSFPNPYQERGASAHPIIEKIKEITNYYPPKPIWDHILTRLKEESPGGFDIGAFRDAYTGWIAAGHNPKNYDGVIDWYIKQASEVSA